MFSETQQEDSTDVVIIGAGYAGLCMLHRVRQIGLSVRVYERAPDVGGTWYWNRYPGARCDVESLDYQFAFSDELQRGWRWKERFAEQKEILAYLNYVTESLKLRPYIQLDTAVTNATYCEEERGWNIVTQKGDKIRATFCVSAVGCLSTPRIPDIKGLSRYQGRWIHTGEWPGEEINFAKKNVGVIGTGSSGIQIIPVLAQEAKSLTVFQRTPNFSIPAKNQSHSDAYINEYHDSFLEKRKAASTTVYGNVTWSSYPSALDVSDEERNKIYERYWEEGGAGFMVSFADVLTDIRSNNYAAEFVRSKISEMVRDKDLAKVLQPRDHPLGTKRICVDTDYYHTYNRNNVRLVDVKNAPIKEITKNGVRTEKEIYEVDMLIFATGFDAMTGTLLNIDIRGRDGIKLSSKWRAGPLTYLGLTVSGFPNFFIITGPGSPSVLSNMVLSIEQHVDWIGNCMSDLKKRGAKSIEARVNAENSWVEHVIDVADRTLYTQCESWYKGANIPGKPRVFMPYVGGIGYYKEQCDNVANSGYKGFKIS